MQAFEVLYHILTKNLFLFIHLVQLDIEAQFAHHGYIQTKLERLFSPGGNVGCNAFGWEEMGESPLDKDTLHSVGVVACPEFGEVLQCFVVATCTSAGTQHHRKGRIFILHPFKYLVQSAYMFDVEMRLLVFEVGRIDVGNGAVAVPFKVCDARIAGHQFVHNTENIVLHFGITEVQYQLITEVIGFSVGQMDGPVGMLLKQLALGVHHFGFDPESEFHALRIGLFYKVTDTVGQLLFYLGPVAQSLGVAVARILGAKPAVVQ